MPGSAYPRHELVWADSYRLIPSRFPPVSLFNAVVDPVDLAVVFAIGSLSNPCLRDKLGQL